MSFKAKKILVIDFNQMFFQTDIIKNKTNQMEQKNLDMKIEYG